MPSEKDDMVSELNENFDVGTMLTDEFDSESAETSSLQPPPAKTKLSRNRGTRLSRAILLSRDGQQAPERIELVSKPFMVFGRFNENTGKGFGDFSLGFIRDFQKISRLQFAVCAMNDSLAAMHVSGFEASYTRLNTVKLARGCWQRLESKDILDVCGIYPLKVTLGWDFSAPPLGKDREPVPGQKLGAQLLEVVDLLKLLEVSDAISLKQKLRDGYANFLRLQAQTVSLVGADSLGPLLYARFHREDDNRHRVTHVYLPKRLPLGSSQQAGLVINARRVEPQHAELLFKGGMYWIHNYAGEGTVSIGNYPLDSGEILPLETGDTLSIGEAQFLFQGY